jgi:hypothetical protein
MQRHRICDQLLGSFPAFYATPVFTVILRTVHNLAICFFKGSFNMLLRLTPRISKWSLTFRCNELTSRSGALLQKSPFAQLLKNFPAFYGTRSFITVFRLGPGFFVTFHNKLILKGEELLAPRPNPQAGGPPLVGCPRLPI